MTGRRRERRARPADAGGERRRRLDVPAELALLLASLAATLGITRLVTPAGPSLFGPVLAATVAGHVSAAIGQRRGRRQRRGRGSGAGLWALPPLCGAALAVVAVVVWSVLPATTWWGVPLGATVDGLAHGLRTGFAEAASSSSPVLGRTGIVLLVSLASGCVGIAGRWLWRAPRRGHRATLLPALAPSFAAFCYAALLSANRARVPAAIGYVVAALAFLLLAGRHDRRPLPSPGAIAATGATGGGRGAGWAGAVSLAAVAVSGTLFTLQLAPVAGLTLSAFATHHGSLAGPVTTLDLEADIGAVLASGSHDVMFQAAVDGPLHHPTYWEVTTLVDDRGGKWLPGPAAARASGQASGAAVTPPTLHQPATGRGVRGQVILVNLRTALLPVPSTAGWVASSHRPLASLLPGVGARVLGGAAERGYQYGFTVTAPRQAPGAGGTSTPRTGTFSSPPLEPLPPDAPNGSWASLAVRGAKAYLQLPAEPRAVVRLARRLPPSGASPAQTASAIEKFLTSGRFLYTLQPPPTPPGRDPLVQFLFDSHQGFCQQFATAFAVLARLDHLPTRLVVGFTPGVPHPSEHATAYTVTAADAHVWPQVYLGPGEGWVDFEPTPGDGSGAGARPGPVVPSGSAATGTTPVQTAPATTGTSPSNAGSGSAHRAPEGVGSGTQGARSPTSAREPMLPILYAVAGLVALLVAAAWLAARRRRALPGRPRPGASLRQRLSWWLGPTRGGGSSPSRRARSPARGHGAEGAVADPRAAVVVACWERAERHVGLAGLGRLPSETLREHASRLDVLLRDEAPEIALAYTRLVHLAELVAYGSAAVPPHGADEARRLLGVLRSLLGRRRLEPEAAAGRR